MASSAKDIQLLELKDTITQLKTMISEQTELIRSLRLVIDEKTSHEKALQEQVDYLTKKLFGSSSERRTDDIPGQPEKTSPQPGDSSGCPGGLYQCGKVYDPEPHGGTVRRASGEDGHGKRYAVRHIGDQRP